MGMNHDRTTQEQWAELADGFYTELPTAPLVFQRGEGVWLYDSEGRRFLDFAAGIAVCALGHSHPEMVKAISAQARELLHVSNLYLNKPSIVLAERLTEISFADRVYFANSGTEANEAALKMARRYALVVKDQPEGRSLSVRPIVSMVERGPRYLRRVSPSTIKVWPPCPLDSSTYPIMI